jgi:hypothetical protein
VSSWADPALKTVFAQKIQESATTWYPYPAVSTASGTSPSSSSQPTSLTQNSDSKSKTPSFVWPLVGGLLGALFVIVGACVAFLIVRRRKAPHEVDMPSPPNAVVRHSWFGKSGSIRSHKDVKEEKAVMDPNGTYPEAFSPSMLKPSDAYGIYNQQQTVYHELPTERNPTELDGGVEVEKKGAVVNEDSNSIAPTPASESSDPISNLSTPAIGRQSVFSEMTNPVSPVDIKPDSPIDAADTSLANMSASAVSDAPSWWRRSSSRFSHHRSGSKK